MLLFYEFLGVIGRWALTMAGAWLVTHHVLSNAQSETYVTAFSHDLVLILPSLGALGWGMWTRYHTRQKLVTALMPGVHTEDQVNAILKYSDAIPTVFTPTNTVPGVPIAVPPATVSPARIQPLFRKGPS